MNYLIMGIRGSGKGTQAKLLARKLEIPHISTGEICRGIDRSTNLGNEVAKYYDKGELVPNKLITQLLRQRIEQEDCKEGIVLDGYPRNLKQAELIEDFLTIDKAVSLQVSDQEVINRLTGRVFCSNNKCEAIFNKLTQPKPKKEGICDKCGSKLIERHDITAQRVKEDIDRYHEESDPLEEYYEKEGKLIKVNGEQSIEQVQAEIQNKLGLS